MTPHRARLPIQNQKSKQRRSNAVALHGARHIGAPASGDRACGWRSVAAIGHRCVRFVESEEYARTTCTALDGASRCDVPNVTKRHSLHGYTNVFGNIGIVLKHQVRPEKRAWLGVACRFMMSTDSSRFRSCAAKVGETIACKP